MKCTLVQRCSGIDGTWGYRAENYELARKVAAPLGREIEAAGNAVVCGDCHLANGVDPPGDRDTARAPDAADGPGLRRRDRRRVGGPS